MFVKKRQKLDRKDQIWIYSESSMNIQVINQLKTLKLHIKAINGTEKDKIFED